MFLGKLAALQVISVISGQPGPYPWRFILMILKHFWTFGEVKPPHSVCTRAEVVSGDLNPKKQFVTSSTNSQLYRYSGRRMGCCAQLLLFVLSPGSCSNSWSPVLLFLGTSLKPSSDLGPTDCHWQERWGIPICFIPCPSCPNEVLRGVPVGVKPTRSNHYRFLELS